jgi:XTP/dITP diphosphohydrolase
MTQILLATSNKHKVREITKLLPVGPKYLSLEKFPDLQMPEETEDSIKGNAVLKAKFCAKASGKISLADDTGLEVDFLDGAPGVFSARYAGPECSYKDNNVKLLKELKDVPVEKRTARFRCVVVLAHPNGEYVFKEGILEGHIGFEEKGTNGFGYDPIFVVKGKQVTLAELSLEEKNSISHRSQAILKISSEILRIAK